VLTWRHLADAPELGLDSDAVHARTGCPLHPSFWPLKIAALQARGVRAARYLSFSDLLTDGRTSLSMASGTGLLGLDGRWDAELLETLALDERQLPELADELVLGDGAAANLGSGAVGPSRAALTIGTSAALRTVHEPSAPRPGLFLYRLDGERVCEGGSLSDGGNLLDWLERLLGSVETAGLADDPPAELDFLTLLGGERSPGWDAAARGALSGLSFETSARDLVRAALYGVAYRFAEIAERMPEVEELVGSGGALLNNPDWAQIVADVLERPLTLSGVDEASARGAAVFALERLGHTPAPAPLGRRFEPRPERFEAHRAARERQRRLYALAAG
jgi:gluconokinase